MLNVILFKCLDSYLNNDKNDEAINMRILMIVCNDNRIAQSDRIYVKINNVFITLYSALLIPQVNPIFPKASIVLHFSDMLLFNKYFKHNGIHAYYFIIKFLNSESLFLFPEN